jgi:hypothetical protein
MAMFGLVGYVHEHPNKFVPINLAVVPPLAADDLTFP